MKTIVFGAGYEGRVYINYTKHDQKEQIVAVVDNNIELWGLSNYGHVIQSPTVITNIEYDQIVIAINNETSASLNTLNSIVTQLNKLGVNLSKICLPRYKREDESKDNRITFIESLSKIICGEGAVAECGVYRGQFAQYINEFFPTRKLYLFDSFEGFSQSDINKSDDSIWLNSIRDNTGETKLQYFTHGSELVTLLRCRHKDNVIIKKGFVPDTFTGITDKFVFVNLDMDIYEPQYQALKWFIPRMTEEGLILLHEYFPPSWQPDMLGTYNAVEEIAKEYSFVRFPIGDGLSIALKNFTKL